MTTFNKVFNAIVRNGAFVLTFFTLCFSFYLSLKKDADVGTLFPTLLGLYLTHQASRGISSVWAASKDPSASTIDAIKQIDGTTEPGKTPHD